MADVYTEPTISGYNSSPPADDGTQVASNQVEWAKHINKIGDPLNNYADAINTNITTAFGKSPFLAGLEALTTTYTLRAADQGKVLYCTNTFTLTLLAAATAGSQFVVTIVNTGTGVITVDGSGAETIVTGGGVDGASVVLAPGDSLLITSDGTSTWYGLKAFGNMQVSSPADNDVLTYNSSNARWQNEPAGNNHNHDIHTHVNNANGNPNISDTTIDIRSVVTKDTWESIGPTGSGADNIWAALDNVPSDADWIKLRIIDYATITGGTANTAYTQIVYARKNGSSELIGSDNQISFAGTYSNSSGSARATDVQEITIPISSRMFDVYWAGAPFSASSSITLIAVGYGFNEVI